MFKDVPNQVDFVSQEHEVLDFWRENNAFRKLTQLRAGSPTFSFMDGPATANNPLGVHHAWGRTYKDLYQRFKAMQGYDQRWQNGFDCQGLWVEVNVERDLGFKTKKDIEDYGIDPFVILCKQRVLHYAAVQTEQSIRLGMWMDWDDPDQLRWLRDKLGEDPSEVITVEVPRGPVTGTVEQIVGRLGLPELGGSYYTFSDENNYQIWSVLKRCWKKGWLYKGTDVMPWCARCGTGISQHEIVTDGYQELVHPSVYLRFPLRGRDHEALLVWTTTPWTLTSNVAAAVGPDLTYVKVRQGEWVYYLARGTLSHAVQGDYEVLGKLSGEDMVGWTYDGPFDDLTPIQRSGAVDAHRVIPWRDVGETEGTGIVHIAPGCGAEDFQLSKEHDLIVVAPLDENGVYVEGFDWLTGRSAQEVADDIFADLERKGLLYHLADYTHRYPTCWRCREELVFRLVDEWFISMGELYDKPDEEVTEEEKERSLRYQIMDVTSQIRWIPAFGLEREMDWLRNMHDWMISKKRYWGLALPIWECTVCGHFEVIGSEHELKERAVEGWEEFEGHAPHRPWVDAVKVICPNCGSKVSRIKDVGNPWLDAGIVPFSTLGYRHDREYWQKWFPADFITESFPGQFRNWFYSMLVMSTVLERKPPYLTCFGYATLLGGDGRPMHKSWGNMIEFNEAAEEIGADVMRWMFVNHKPETDLPFGYAQADETRRRFLIPLWNVYSFFVTYANLDGWTPRQEGTTGTEGTKGTWGAVPASSASSFSSLDRWIIARLNQTLSVVIERLENYDAWKAASAIEQFVDDLSNWYVRRSRRRFWKSEVDADKEAAYSTLYHVLVTLTRMLAPFTPFVTETMYQNLVRSVDDSAPESVHHCPWPEVDVAAVDEELLADMDLAVRVASLGRSARSSANIKLRQPLASAVVHAPDGAERLGRVSDLIVDELNVKQLEIAAAASELVTYRLVPDGRPLGPRLGRLFPKVRAALDALEDPTAFATALQAGESFAVKVDGQTVELGPDEVFVHTEARSGYAVASEGGITVAVDAHITPELAAEGLAREVVRHIQVMRREAGFELDDRIVTTYQAAEDVAAAIEAFYDYIAGETLSVRLEQGPPETGGHVETTRIDGQSVTLSVRRL